MIITLRFMVGTMAFLIITPVMAFMAVIVIAMASVFAMSRAGSLFGVGISVHRLY